MQNENPLSNVEALIESFQRLKAQQLQLDISHYESDELEQYESANYYQLEMTRARLLMMGVDPDTLSELPI